MPFVLRAAIAAIGASVATTALASFDLMLLPGADGRIHRYDPVNQIQLGSFVGSPNVAMIAADTSGTSLSGNTLLATFRRHEYSTGELTTAYNLTGATRFIEYYGNEVVWLAGLTVRKANRTNGLGVVSASLATGITWYTGTVAGSFLIAVGLNSSNAISIQTMDLSTMTAGTLRTSATTVTALSGLGKAAQVANSSLGSRRLAFTYMNGANVSLASVALDFTTGNNLSATVSTTAVSGSGGFSAADLMPAAVAGHSGLWVYGADATVPTTLARMTRFDLASSLLYTDSDTFSAPGGEFLVSGGAWHPANVVAPEPGTFLALGAGALALLRRRNRVA